MNVTPQEQSFEIAVVFSLNIYILYLAAFRYNLEWLGILSVIVVSSVVIPYINRLFKVSNKSKDINEYKRELLSEAFQIMIIALFSGLASFIILVYRFNFFMAIGLSIVSTIVTYFVQKLISKF